MPTFAHLCRSFSCPGSIAMIAFLHPSLSCASFGSTWCCFRSLLTQSIHLSMGLPRGIFLPPLSMLLALQRSCLLFSLHGHTTKGVPVWHMWWLAWPLHRSWTFWFCLSLFCPQSILACSSPLCASFAALLCVAPNIHCHTKVGLMTVLYSLFFSLTVTFLSQITPDNTLQEFPLIVLFYRQLRHILRLLILLIPSTWMSCCC